MDTNKPRFVSRHRFWLVVAAFLLAQLLLWFVLFQRFWFAEKASSSVYLYFIYGQRIASGLVPYRDFYLEYPPVVAPVFYLPYLLSGPDYGRYFYWYEIETLVFSAGITIMLSLAVRQYSRSLKTLAAVLLTYVLCVAATGSLVQVRFYLMIGFMVVASLVLYLHGRPLVAWSFLGIGAMLKLVPLLLAPLYLISDHRRGRRGWVGPAVMGATSLLIALPFLLTAPAGLARSFLDQSSRPVQLESTWALPFLWARQLLAVPVRTEFTHGSDNIISSHTGVISLLSAVLLLAALAWGYYEFYLVSRDAGGGPAAAGGRMELVRFAAVALLTFILLGKVFSPQYVIWLLPLIPLVTGAGRRWVAGLFAGALLLTQYEFPYRYPKLVQMQGFMVGTVTLRDLLLAAMLVVLLAPWKLKRKPIERKPDAYF